MFNLVYTRRAMKAIERLDHATKRRIGQKLLRYAEDSFRHAEKISDSPSNYMHLRCYLV